MFDPSPMHSQVLTSRKIQKEDATALETNSLQTSNVIRVVPPGADGKIDVSLFLKNNFNNKQ